MKSRGEWRCKFIKSRLYQNNIPSFSFVVPGLPCDFPFDSEEVGHDQLVGGKCSVSLQEHKSRMRGPEGCLVDSGASSTCQVDLKVCICITWICNYVDYRHDLSTCRCPTAISDFARRNICVFSLWSHYCLCPPRISNMRCK